MARILVQTDDGTATLLDERHVDPVRLESEHESLNLIERLAWAVEEAERQRRRRRRRRKADRDARRHIRAVESGVGRTFD